MNNSQWADLLTATTEMLASWKGREISVVESISRSPGAGGHDRHFATRSALSFSLERAMWAISGGRLMLLGTDSRFGYEVAFDAVSAGTVGASEVRLVESLGASVVRVSTITVCIPLEPK
jgi:hypothetical protein